MSNLDKYYINGEWVVPLSKTKMNVILYDNDMYIAKQVGSMRTYLEKLLPVQISFTIS